MGMNKHSLAISYLMQFNAHRESDDNYFKMGKCYASMAEYTNAVKHYTLAIEIHALGEHSLKTH